MDSLHSTVLVAPGDEEELALAGKVSERLFELALLSCACCH
jgi:hypothetical protein